eukprot:6214272-Pleurochrysis_carterae.AAC.1
MAPSRLGRVTGVTVRRRLYKRFSNEAHNEKDSANEGESANAPKCFVQQFALGKRCKSSCPDDRKCDMNFTPRNLICAHEAAFGTNNTRTQLSDGTFKYEGEKNSTETNRFWKSLVAAAITTSASDPTRQIEHFTTDGSGPVCPDYSAVAYGVQEGTLTPMLSDARAGRLQADMQSKAAGGDPLQEFRQHQKRCVWLVALMLCGQCLT